MSTLVYSARKKAEERISASLHKVTDLLVYEREHLCEFERLRAIEYGLRQIQLMLRSVEAIEGEDDDAILKQFFIDAKLLATNVNSVVNASRSSNWRPRGCKGFINKLFNHHIALYKLIYDIDVLKSSVSDLRVRGEALGLKSVEPRNDIKLPNQSFSTDEMKEGDDIIGSEEDVHMIMLQLIDGHSSRKVVSILGAKGMGKTALARKIYKKALQHTFHYCAWVTLPEIFEIDHFLLIIAKQVIAGFENFNRDWSKEELRKRIQDILISGRYFVVLDNVMTYKTFEELQSLFPDESNSSRILITTCDRAITLLSQSDSNQHFILEKRALSDEKSWELFTSKVIVPPGVEKLGRAIVKKCNGLPRAIAAAGEFLSSKPAVQEHWSEVLEQIVEDEATYYCALNLAARALPSHLHLCLTYFGLLPQDYDIPARKLILLWIAEGLVQQIDGRTLPEDIAEKYLRDLENLNMIQVGKRKPDGKIKTCRIHYLLRAQWVKNAKEANFVYSRRLTDNLDKNDDSFYQIHGSNSGTQSLLSRYSDLRSFLSFDSREGYVPGREIGKFLSKGLQCFTRLQVIDLENVFRPKLPKEIGKLTELKYLGLRRTYLEVLPSSLGHLLKLQTLDLKHTNISVLPFSIWKMLHLRHLYLNDIYRGRFIASPSASSLTELQTLWGAFLDEDSPVRDGLDRFINLRKLSLVCQLTRPQQFELAKWLPKLSCLQSLKLRSIDESVQPSSLYIKTLSSLKNLTNLYLFGRLENQTLMHHLPESLTEITLSLSKLTEDPMPMLEKLPKLRVLRLMCSSYTGSTLVCSAGGFPFLRVLKLCKLEEVQVWIVKKGAMPIVLDIEIRSCNKLRTVPEGIQHLKHCRELKFKSMPEEFKSRVVSRDWNKISHVPLIHFEV
ncbi:hypothetical protein ACFE04_014675 [Oxalis oulophora]